jgi:hypothetical protein
VRHKTEPGTLVAGLLFCVFGGLYLVANVQGWHLPWIWLLPALFVGLGIAGLVGIMARGHHR